MPQMTRLLRSMNLFESSPRQMNNNPEKELTLKGKKNHYNVKLLRGYGVSINLKDNKVILKNGLPPKPRSPAQTNLDS